MPQIYSFFLIPQQYHLLHLEVIIVIYEQIPGKVPPGKAKLWGVLGLVYEVYYVV